MINIFTDGYGCENSGNMNIYYQAIFSLRDTQIEFIEY